MTRDMVGYGKTPPTIEWPDGARIAVSIVVNYEEGSERSPAYGDRQHETGGEMPSNKPAEARDLQIESQWEYGARAGVWRLLRVLEQQQVKASFFVCAMALEQNPMLGPEIVARGHDIVSHGYRWEPQWHLGPDEERALIRRAADSIERTTGRRPIGWYTRAGQSENTRRLLAEEGFIYDSDGLNDDLPYYASVDGKPWLVVPYTHDCNDTKFWHGDVFAGSHFVEYLRDSFDLLYEEEATHPKLLSIGLHSRISGRPGRAAAIARFLEYIRRQPRVWIAGRDEIARWWMERYPPAG